MGLLNTPEDVAAIKEGLLPLLEWNDLLRFRRISKEFNQVVIGYLQEHPELAPELEIDEGDKTFAAFLKMGIPTTKLFVNNLSGYKFYERVPQKDMSEFLTKYGPTVKRLRVCELCVYIFCKEWDFLEGFPTLEAFEAEWFGLGTKMEPMSELELDYQRKAVANMAKEDPRFINSSPPIPQNFRGLKFLKIGQNENLQMSSHCIRYDEFLDFSPELEYVGLPLDLYWGTPQEDSQHSLKMTFIGLRDYLVRNRAPALKTVDFFSYYSVKKDGWLELDGFAGSAFRDLLTVAFEKNIKLLNVRSKWSWQSGDLPVEVGKVIESMINLYGFKFFNGVDMVNLERIEIRNTSKCLVMEPWKQHRFDWPILQVLDITVDTGDKRTKTLFRFLFEDVKRLALTELRLNFVKGKEEVVAPKLEDVVASCPNLKKLTIINWPGTNKELIKLWEGLPGLEEITLDKCKNVGNVTFVGQDRNDPVFLKLKKLRKLTLIRVDEMPKITDLLFSLVIRHLKLTHFVITAEEPIEKVTVAGINLLLAGKFAETIEKFPFKGWCLKDVSSKDFQQLEKQFRSFNML